MLAGRKGVDWSIASLSLRTLSFLISPLLSLLPMLREAKLVRFCRTYCPYLVYHKLLNFATG
ncbi:hypothetical protein GBAR_LOCUS20168 [Geodia barretti]|uniref:Uncharacterized protein n=1 Tax=Geodia barretti TaxID=519541 RepID=A0AA35SUI2_GEOBA|nr:hypothetical protein GBAR_LOCUS20168 [Geodia barretti]